MNDNLISQSHLFTNVVLRCILAFVFAIACADRMFTVAFFTFLTAANLNLIVKVLFKVVKMEPTSTTTQNRTKQQVIRSISSKIYWVFTTLIITFFCDLDKYQEQISERFYWVIATGVVVHIILALITATIDLENYKKGSYTRDVNDRHEMFTLYLASAMLILFFVPLCSFETITDNLSYEHIKAMKKISPIVALFLLLFAYTTNGPRYKKQK